MGGGIWVAIRGRAALVFADAYHFGGQFNKARPWYEQARIHATTEGDEATLSALFHNVAAFRADNVRLADAFGNSLPGEARRASNEAKSALHYDAAIGTSSFRLLIPLIQGQMLVVAGSFTEALAAFQSIDEQSLPQHQRSAKLVDEAWCHCVLGDIHRASSKAVEAASLAISIFDAGDSAYLHARLSEIAAKTGEDSIAKAHMAIAKAKLEEHRAIQSTVVGLLDGVEIEILKSK